MSAAIEREESLFETARGLTDPARRRAFLDEACGEDAALRRKIDELVTAAERADEFFARCAPALRPSANGSNPMPAPGTDTSRATAGQQEKPSSRIGPYKLLQKIGEGGCGVVY